MNFQSIFGITKFNQDKNQNFSISFDFFDIVYPVLLIIPDKNDYNHDHVRIKNIKDLSSLINGQKVSFPKDHTVLKIEQNNLIIFNIDNTDEVLFEIPLMDNFLQNMNDWLTEFNQLSPDEKKQRYHDDIKRNLKNNR